MIDVVVNIYPGKLNSHGRFEVLRAVNPKEEHRLQQVLQKMREQQNEWLYFGEGSEVRTEINCFCTLNDQSYSFQESPHIIEVTADQYQRSNGDYCYANLTSCNADKKYHDILEIWLKTHSTQSILKGENKQLQPVATKCHLWLDMLRNQFYPYTEY